MTPVPAQSAAPTDGPLIPGARRHLGRSTLAAVLVVLGILCLFVAPPAVWARNLLLDTDEYVRTLAPIAADPGVQDAVIAAVNQQLSSRIDVSGLLQETLSPRAAELLAPILNGAAGAVVTRVTTDFVRGPDFPRLWEAVNRRAHEQVVRALTGERPPGAVLQADADGLVVLDLSPVVEAVRSALVDAGLTGAARISVTGTTIEIAQLQGLASARSAVSLLDTVAGWLPWAGLALLTGGVLVATRRRRTVIRAASGVAIAMVLLGCLLLVVRAQTLGAISGPALSHEVARDVFDMLAHSLRLGVVAVLAVAVLVALAAWLTASTSAPRRALRSAFTAGRLRPASPSTAPDPELHAPPSAAVRGS